MAVAQACAHAHGGQVSALGDVQIQVGCLDAQFRAFDFRSGHQRLVIGFLRVGYHACYALVVGYVRSHVEALVNAQFQQGLELALVVGNLCLAVHHVILGAAQLRFQLQGVGFGHQSLLHHFQSALVLAFGGLLHLLVHLDGFLGVQNLHIELCYLFLNAHLALGGVQFGNLVLELLCLNVLLVDASVPYGPRGVYAIGALIRHLVAGVCYLAVLHKGRVLFKGSVAHALACVHTQAGQQLAFVEPQVHLAFLLADLVLLNLYVMSQGVVNAVLQAPCVLRLCVAETYRAKKEQ